MQHLWMRNKNSIAHTWSLSISLFPPATIEQCALPSAVLKRILWGAFGNSRMWYIHKIMHFAICGTRAYTKPSRGKSVGYYYFIFIMRTAARVFFWHSRAVAANQAVIIMYCVRAHICIDTDTSRELWCLCTLMYRLAGDLPVR